MGNSVSGIEPGQRPLNGPQTSGRDYRNLSKDLLPLRCRIPLVANARRFRTGHRVRLFLTSDDQDPQTPALLTFRQASVGTSSLNTVRSSSRLVLPVVSGLGRK
jgi:hypothetical protein